MSASYQLLAPAPRPPPAPNPIALLALGQSAPFAAFLGAGLTRPFRRDQKSDFANDVGVNLIRSCVGQILGTRASDDSGNIQGELRWRPAFGSKLYLLKHKKGPHLPQYARVYCQDALARWEPRVTNIQCVSAFFPTELLLVIDLVYDIIAKNVPGNNVLFPNVTQQVGAPMVA